jgi:hypothetical protein
MSKEVFPDDMGLAPYVDFAHPLSAVSHKVPPNCPRSLVSSRETQSPASNLAIILQSLKSEIALRFQSAKRTPVGSASTNRPSALTSRIRPSRPFALRL